MNNLPFCRKLCFAVPEKCPVSRTVVAECRVYFHPRRKEPRTRQRWRPGTMSSLFSPSCCAWSSGKRHTCESTRTMTRHAGCTQTGYNDQRIGRWGAPLLLWFRPLCVKKCDFSRTPERKQVSVEEVVESAEQSNEEPAREAGYGNFSMLSVCKGCEFDDMSSRRSSIATRPSFYGNICKRAPRYELQKTDHEQLDVDQCGYEPDSQRSFVLLCLVLLFPFFHFFSLLFSFVVVVFDHSTPQEPRLSLIRTSCIHIRSVRDTSFCLHSFDSIERRVVQESQLNHGSGLGRADRCHQRHGFSDDAMTGKPVIM